MIHQQPGFMMVNTKIEDDNDDSQLDFRDTYPTQPTPLDYKLAERRFEHRYGESGTSRSFVALLILLTVAAGVGGLYLFLFAGK